MVVQDFSLEISEILVHMLNVLRHLNVLIPLFWRSFTRRHVHPYKNKKGSQTLTTKEAIKQHNKESLFVRCVRAFLGS